MRTDYSQKKSDELREAVLKICDSEERHLLDTSIDVLMISEGANLTVVMNHCFLMGKLVGILSKRGNVEESKKLIELFYLEMQQHDKRYAYNADGEFIRA